MGPTSQWRPASTKTFLFSPQCCPVCLSFFLSLFLSISPDGDRLLSSSLTFDTGRQFTDICGFEMTKRKRSSIDHWNTAFFTRRSRKGAIMAASFLDKLPSWLTNPHHERRSVRFLGWGISLTDFNRSGLVWMPVFDRRNPPTRLQ